MEPLRQVYEGVMLTQVVDGVTQMTTSNLRNSFYAEGASTNVSPPRRLVSGERDVSLNLVKRDFKFSKNPSLAQTKKTWESWAPKSAIPDQKEWDKEAYSWDFTSGDEKKHPSNPDFFSSARGWKKSTSKPKSRGPGKPLLRDRMSDMSGPAPLSYEVYLGSARKHA